MANHNPTCWRRPDPLVIRFVIIDVVQCESCKAQVHVLSRPPGMSSVPGEGSDDDPYTDTLDVFDFAGCWLRAPREDLIGRVGYAVRLFGPRPLACEPEGGEEVYGRPTTHWEIMVLCCSQLVCGEEEFL